MKLGLTSCGYALDWAPRRERGGRGGERGERGERGGRGVLFIFLYAAMRNRIQNFCIMFLIWTRVGTSEVHAAQTYL